MWWGQYNRPFNPESFSGLHARLCGYLQGRDVFVQDVYGGADPEHRLAVRIVTQKAWHSLFARTMFLKNRTIEEHRRHVPDFTIIAAPGFQASPMADGTRSETFIVLNFRQKLAVIGGTGYAGEIKKTVFTVLNYLLPLEGVLSMHCSANVGPEGDVAIFFGLSGTGKTTLSAPTPRAASSGTTSTAGATTASSTSRTAATRRSSASPPTPSRRSTPPPAASGRSSRTSSTTPSRGSSTSTTRS